MIALRKAMKSAGVTFDKRLAVEGEHTLDGGSIGMEILLNLPKPPTAVLCCNDVAAIGALKALGKEACRPEKISR
jgi:DNA-binding LacI/PurR family transcriptional regulator